MDNHLPENENLTVGKIEVDEKTNEPVIVETSVEDIPEHVEVLNLANETSSDDNNIPFSNVSDDERHSIGKQMVMNKVIGLPNKDDDISKRKKIFKYIVTALFIAFVVGVLVFTAYNDFSGNGNEQPASFAEIMAVLGQNWYYLLFALLALVLMYAFKAFKLSIICKQMTGKFHLKTCIETSILGVYYNNVTPLAVGGQPFEIYHLSKHKVQTGCATSAPIATFFLNQLAFVVCGIISIILFSTNALGLPDVVASSPVMTGAIIVAGIGCACCFIVPALVITFCFMPKMGARAVHLVMFIGGKLKIVKKPKETTFRTIKNVVNNSRCLKKIAKNPLTLISNIALSFGEQLANCSIAYFSLKFFGFQPGIWGVNIIGWAQVLELCFILYAAVSFVPTPGNSGAADLSFAFLFSAVGLGKGFVFPAMLTWRIISFYLTLVIGFIFTTVKRRADKKHAQLGNL